MTSFFLKLNYILNYQTKEHSKSVQIITKFLDVVDIPFFKTTFLVLRADIMKKANVTRQRFKYTTIIKI